MKLLLAFIMLPLALAAEPAKITVNVDQPAHKISPLLWGIFFEEISLAADGGINPELVRNRSFEDSDKTDPWVMFGTDPRFVDMSIDREKPVSEKNPRSLKVVISLLGNERAGVVNEGYFGMSVVKGENYKFSFNARSDGTFTGPLTVSCRYPSHEDYS